MAADYKTLLGLVREFAEAEHFKGIPCGDLMDRARAAVASTPKPESAILHSWPWVVADPCCDKQLRLAAKAGKLDEGTEWTCGKCGTRFVPTVKIYEGSHIRIWQAVSIIEVLHGRT